ncbi:MAG: gamma-glutamyltransferase [Chloroflexi bacterium]|nr:gamma-glutamyltransferase [Chloroflexota bacterium]MDA1146324.1 gamma-glutamyltransferase [Chloroflexota bacterium]
MTTTLPGIANPRGRYDFPTVKQPAVGSKGMVTSNHPLASLAGNEMLVNGGNAVDAAIATMFALTVVEPMMVTIFGAGFVNIRMADGTAVVIDNYATVPHAATPDLFDAIPPAHNYEVVDDLNALGHKAVAVGGTLLGWCTAVEKYGRLPLADVMAPAIRFARRGFRVSPYLNNIITIELEGMRAYEDTASVFLKDGQPPAVGDTIVREAYADTLEAISTAGADYLYHGPLGLAIADDMAANGGLITMEEIENYQIYERPPVRGMVRGYEIVAPPPPSSGATHIIQMLKILNHFPIAEMGFASPDYTHLLSEAMKIAFADRTEFMADPLTSDIPIDWLTSDEYAAQRAEQIMVGESQDYVATVVPDREQHSTTHCSTIDEDGNIVATTNTLHYTFGSKVTVPGTGMLLNNCMQLMDPIPGRTNSIAPGKRILSSMSPVIVLKDDQPFMSLGTPGGLRIFGAVAQAIANVIVHGMTLQQAVEAPRMWDRGLGLELEQGFEGFGGFDALSGDLGGRGHEILPVYKVAGGMNGLMRDPETGLFIGAACWRADGAPMGYSGGDALVQRGDTMDTMRRPS